MRMPGQRPRTSASMRANDRTRLAEMARASLVEQAGRLKDVELRVVNVPEHGDDGTHLFDAIAAAPDLPADAGRLFHGRGGRFPGCEHLALDVYPPVVLLTSFQPLADDALAAVGRALQARWPTWPAQRHSW